MFKYKERKMALPSSPSPIILFGVRGCDVKGIEVLDKVFKSKEVVDSYWEEKYGRSVIFGLKCNEMRNGCFCTWMNGGPLREEGMDVVMVEVKEGFVVEGRTTRGREVVEGLNLREPEEKEIKEKEEITKKVENESEEKVELKGVEKKLVELWEDSLWEEISERCIGCGVCTYLCPTCHCFDIQDEGEEEGERIRIWDSCMFKLFTQEAAGTNPRPTRRERVRGRVMHKFRYLVENIGEIGCTGCGRCVRECPVKIDVREVVEKIKEK
jgi:ferredoxin